MTTIDVVEELQRHKVVANALTKGPLGNDTFALSMTRTPPVGIIRVWQPKSETLDLAVVGDAKKRQAVISAVEPARTIRKTLKINGRQNPGINRFRTRFRNSITLPGSPAIIVGEIKDVTKPRKGEHIILPGQMRTWEATISAKVAKSDQHFLVGMDETYQFIAALRGKVESVDEAHEILRPKVKSDAIRQGEWFFNPLSTKLSQELDDYVGSNPLAIKAHRMESSTHECLSSITYMGKRYASGWVVDHRASHHAPLWLDDWHEVIRNNEVVVARTSTNMRRVTRYWD